MYQNVVNRVSLLNLCSFTMEIGSQNFMAEIEKKAYAPKEHTTFCFYFKKIISFTKHILKYYRFDNNK